MQINNRILRSSVSMLLIFALFVTGLFLYPVSSYAVSQEVTITKHRLDTGIIFIWCNSSGVWQSGREPGSSYTYQASLPLGEGKKNVQIAPYTRSNFDFDDPNSIWYETAKASSKKQYDNNYYWKGAHITNTSINYSGNTASFSVNVTLNANDGKPYDVVETLSSKGKQEILDLMGGTSNKHLEDFMNRTDFSGQVKGQLYFVPTVISWEETVMQEIPDVPDPEPGAPIDLEASIGLPSAGTIGTPYDVIDETILPEGAEFASSTIERNDGSGWKSVPSWKGNKPGESISETADQEGSIQYRLTVNLKSGESDTDIKNINIADGTVVDTECHLALPEYTYEGHPVKAEDQSIYQVNGESYSALRAYEEGKATNRFSILESGAGTIKTDKVTPIYATAVFSKKGIYNVQLKITPKNGSSLYDTKPIEVRKTPAVTVQLGGVQKQNRKQTLHMIVATSPDHPLAALHATLTNLDTGEHVTLEHRLGKGANELQNSEHIKTRAIETLEADEYFTSCELPFLTKDKDVTNYRYQVYAKDSSGNWDTVEQDFTVQPDLPPKAKISVQDRFFREKGTNTAVIEMEDVSESDGDSLQRSWYIVEDRNADDDFSGEPEETAESRAGFQDNSFGTKKIVAMSKTGVGKVKLRLHVKDVWNEETLPEYITEDDYLTAETTAETMVDNIAPVVSIKPVTSQTASILLLAAGEGEFAALIQTVNTMQGVLLSHAVDADITLEQMDQPMTGHGNPQYYYHKGQPFGYSGMRSAFEDQCFLIDDKKLYTMEATWIMTGANYWNNKHTYPYTIRAFDHESYNGKKEVWTYRISAGSPVPVSDAFSFAQDDTDTYLYYRCNGKTALFTKDNGTLLTVLPFEVGDSNFVYGDYIYTIKDDGVYRIIRKNGAIQHILTASTPTTARKIQGKVHFYLTSGQNIRRVMLDLKTQQFSYEALPDTDTLGYTCIGIDSAGKMILHKVTDTKNKTGEVRVCNRQNKQIARLNISGNVKPVYDPKGVSNYIASASRNSSSNYKHAYQHLYGYTNGVRVSNDEWSKGGYASTDRVILAAEMADGTVYVSTGANYVDTDMGYGTYPERAVTCCYDPQVKTFTKVSTGYYGGISGVYEYGMETDLFAAAHVGDNSKSDASEGSGTTVIKKPQTMGQIMSRYLDKGLKKTDQMQVVGLYSNQKQEMDAAELKQIADKLKASGTQFFFLTKEAKNAGYGLPLAEQSGGSVLYTQTPAQTLAEALAETEKQERVLLLSADAAGGTLKTNVALQEGKQYFYEYEIKKTAKKEHTGSQESTAVSKDIFQTNLSITENQSPSNLGNSRIYVGDYVYETFSAETNVHPKLKINAGTFSTEGGKHGNAGSGVSYGKPYGGMFGCYIDIFSSKYNGSWPHQETLSFEVPQGQKALAYFDYDLKANNRKALDVNAITFNGKSIATLSRENLEQNGTYSTGLMNPGTKTISMKCGISGKWGAAHAMIDNLKVVFLLDDSNQEPWQPTSSIRSGSDGWSTVLGTFQTPGQTAWYQHWLPGGGAFSLDGIWYVSAASFHRAGSPTFVLSSNETYLIRGLKMYYIENGKRVYAVDETFNRTESLSSWSKNGVSASIVNNSRKEVETDSLVYKKGELVRYGISYYDYEKDPSKDGYWRYTHTPFNDGAHPDAAVVLDENGMVVSEQLDKVLRAPVDRFYVDGKYTVEHWQYDDTSRKTKAGGNPQYDKPSNVESLTFYVEGSASAPWITSIHTSPAVVKEGRPFQIRVDVDDAEKDELQLTTEVYKKKKLIYTHQQQGIRAGASGVYPKITTGIVMPKAQIGAYEVVCTVRDQTGAGLGSYRFYVVSEGKITGKVNHTDTWDQNRKKYNLKLFQNEIQYVIPYKDYLKLREPRKRGANVFWSGEKFVLESAVAGNPTKVTCKIDGTTYTTTMTSTGKKNKDDEVIYSGVLWDQSMINKWGRTAPKELSFTFTSTYEGDVVKTDQVSVIIDSKQDYWMLHRLF